MFKKKNEVAELPKKEVITVVEEKKIAVEPKMITTIAKETCIKGDIELDSNIQIWGKIIGNITAKNGTVTVMHAGVVNGEISAATIVIDGKVKGICSAENLEIQEHGILDGICRTNGLSIKRGGVFIGQSEKTEQISDKRKDYKNKDLNLDEKIKLVENHK